MHFTLFKGTGPQCECIGIAPDTSTKAEVMRQAEVYGNTAPLLAAIESCDLDVLADPKLRGFIAAKVSGKSPGGRGPKKSSKKQERNVRALYLLGFYEALGYPIWDATNPCCCSIVGKLCHISDSQVYKAVWGELQRQRKLSTDEIATLAYKGDRFDECDYVQGCLDGFAIKQSNGDVKPAIDEVPGLSKSYDEWDNAQVRQAPW